MGHRQSALVRRLEKLIVVDGCHNACARQLLVGVGITPDVYLNLEANLHLSKWGPFSGLAFTAKKVNQAADAIVATIREVCGPSGSS